MDDYIAGYLFYLIDSFSQWLVIMAMAVALAGALLMGRPAARNAFGPVPEPVPAIQGILSVYGKAFDFRGRAGRSEIWPWLGINLAVLLAVFLFGSPIFVAVCGTVLFWPGIALGARRLHDINRSAWWLTLALTGLGVLSLLILWAAPSHQIMDGDISDVFE